MTAPAEPGLPAGNPIRIAASAMVSGAATGGAVIAAGLYLTWGMARRPEHLMALALAGISSALALAFLRTRGFAPHHRALMLALAGIGTVILAMLTIPANQLAPRVGLLVLALACAAAALAGELLRRSRRP